MGWLVVLFSFSLLVFALQRGLAVAIAQSLNHIRENDAAAQKRELVVVLIETDLNSFIA